MDDDGRDRPDPQAAMSGVLLAVAALAINGCGLVLLWVYVPRFHAMFKDLGIQLPRLTVMVLEQWRVMSFGLLFAAVVALAIALAPVPSSYRRALPGAVLAVTLLTGLMVLGALFLPLILLIEDLNASTPAPAAP